MTEKTSHTSFTEGHRERLRQKFLTQNLNVLQDYEILEGLLMYAIPRRDVKPLAKTLLETFHSIGGVLCAPTEKLREIKGVSDGTIAFFRLIQASTAGILRRELNSQPALHGWDKIMDYCYVELGREVKESVHILFLDTHWHLISDEKLQEGTINFTLIYPREIIQKVLNSGASSFILIHNHPSGEVKPSQDDIRLTKKLDSMSKALNILFLDHIIISKIGALSFQDEGFLKKRTIK